MATTMYSFNKLCDSNRLSCEIADSSLVTAIAYITTSVAATSIYMKDILSVGDEAILGALVADHVNTPLPDSSVQFITTGKIDPVLGREIFSVSSFSVNTDYEVKAAGFKGTATKTTTTNIDYAIGVEDRYINGIKLLANNGVMGDKVNLMVVDKDNLLGYGAGLVVKQFGFNWNIDPSVVNQGAEIFNYLARIPAGFYVRVSYVSVGTVNDVDVAVNLYLHRKVPT